MKLQLALDLVDIVGAKAILDQVVDLVDIVEVGTPMILREGVTAITETKKAFPQAQVLADMKIMDAGDYEANIAFDAGADIVTVLGVAHDATIQGALRQASSRDRHVMIDMIAVKDMAARARDVDAMGADFVCVHTASDLKASGHDPLKDLKIVGPLLARAALAVAGGITPDSLPQITPHHPDIVAVGSYITGHPDCRQATLEISKLLT